MNGRFLPATLVATLNAPFEYWPGQFRAPGDREQRDRARAMAAALTWAGHIAPDQRGMVMARAIAALEREGGR